MANLIKKIRTDAGDVQIDYNALANLPSINNNLLINGNFSINQRGSTSYIQTNTWKYSVDRWKYVGIMGVTVNESGTVSISKTNSCVVYGGMFVKKYPVRQIILSPVSSLNFFVLIK